MTLKQEAIRLLFAITSLMLVVMLTSPSRDFFSSDSLPTVAMKESLQSSPQTSIAPTRTKATQVTTAKKVVPSKQAILAKNTKALKKLSAQVAASNNKQRPLASVQGGRKKSALKITSIARDVARVRWDRNL